MRAYGEAFIRSREEDTKLEEVSKLFKIFKCISSGRPVEQVQYLFEHYLGERGTLRKSLPRLTVPEMQEFFEDYLHLLRRRP